MSDILTAEESDHCHGQVLRKCLRDKALRVKKERNYRAQRDRSQACKTNM